VGGGTKYGVDITVKAW